MVVPQKWLVYNGKSHLEMDVLGLPPFQESSKWENHLSMMNPTEMMAMTGIRQKASFQRDHQDYILIISK